MCLRNEGFLANICVIIQMISLYKMLKRYHQVNRTRLWEMQKAGERGEFARGKKK